VTCDILPRYFLEKSLLFDTRLNDGKEDGCCVKRLLGGMDVEVVLSKALLYDLTHCPSIDSYCA
jgi:hypothetical protein